MGRKSRKVMPYGANPLQNCLRKGGDIKTDWLRNVRMNTEVGFEEGNVSHGKEVVVEG